MKGFLLIGSLVFAGFVVLITTPAFAAKSQGSTTFTCPVLNGTYTNGQRIADKDHRGHFWMVWVHGKSDATVSNLHWTHYNVRFRPGFNTLAVSCTSGPIGRESIRMGTVLILKPTCTSHHNGTFYCQWKW